MITFKQHLQENKLSELMIELADILSPETFAFFVDVINGRRIKEKTPKNVDLKVLKGENLLVMKNGEWSLVDKKYEILKESICEALSDDTIKKSIKEIKRIMKIQNFGTVEKDKYLERIKKLEDLLKED